MLTSWANACLRVRVISLDSKSHGDGDGDSEELHCES